MSNRQFAANGFVVPVHVIGGWGYTVHLGSWDVWGDVLMPVEDKGVGEGAWYYQRQFGKVCQDELLFFSIKHPFIIINYRCV